jgi:tetratricopeptide (TPR) repeat protein
MQGNAGNVKGMRRSFERALELDFVPHRLYTLAISLSRCERDERKVIRAYERYLEASKKNANRVAEAHYAIACLYMNLGDGTKAVHHWNMALEAERCRMPWFAPVNEKYPPKVELGSLICGVIVPGPIGKCPQSRAPVGEPAAMSCGNCGKASSQLSTCGWCMEIRYCGRECQRQHWPVHKKACKK